MNYLCGVSYPSLDKMAAVVPPQPLLKCSENKDNYSCHVYTPPPKIPGCINIQISFCKEVL